MSENNRPNTDNAVQEEIKYPIILHQNNSINAKPPYKVLRFENGVFMQLIDMHCRKFSDPAISGGSYSIALFKIKEEEAALIQSRPDRLDYLANMLYEHIPQDRFVRASVIRENKPYDIRVHTECTSIDAAAEEKVQETIEPAVLPEVEESAASEDIFRHSESEEAEQTKAAEQPAPTVGRLDLRIVPDVLSDAQRETYVFAPLRSARRLAPADFEAMNVTELVSVAFVTSKCNMQNLPRASKDAQEANFRMLLGLIAERLKQNPFYIIYDRTEEAPVKLFNNGVPFTPVFSQKEMAEATVNANDRMECVEIAINKDDFFRSLLEKGIVQFIVDGNPLTLAVQGYYNYMSNN